MSQPASSLRRRKEYPPRGSEDKIRTEIATSLLLLNMYTLDTLNKYGKPEDYDAFHALIRDHYDNIMDADYPENLSLRWRAKRYVRTLAIDAVDEITTRPIDTVFYQEVIYLMISNIETAAVEEWIISQDGDASPGMEEAAREKLGNIVRIVRRISKHLGDAEANGHLQKMVDPLKAKLRSIEHNIEDACSCLRIDDEPLISSDSAHKKKTSNKPSQSQTTVALAQDNAISVFAFIVPIVCGLSLIPTYFAWSHGGHDPGKATDSDFFQLVASVPIQFLGISTAVWPIVNSLRPDRAVWIQCWTCAGISSCLTVVALPLYVLAPSAWSGMSLIFGSIAQAFLQLQLLLAIRKTKAHVD